MSTRVTAFSEATGAQTFRFFTDAGAEPQSGVTASAGPTDSKLFFATVPSALAAGSYTFGLYSGTDLKATGSFYWTGTEILRAATVVEVNAARDAVTNAISALDFATEAEVNAARDAVTTAVTALDFATEAQVNAARDIVTGDIGGLDFATETDVNAARDVVLSGLSNLDTDVSEARGAVLGAIGNLSDLTPFEVQNLLTPYATGNDILAVETRITDAVGPTVSARLGMYDVATNNDLRPLRDVQAYLLADEYVTIDENGVGTLERRNRDTNSTLTKKVVNSTPGVAQVTTLIEDRPPQNDG